MLPGLGTDANVQVIGLGQDAGQECCALLVLADSTQAICFEFNQHTRHFWALNNGFSAAQAYRLIWLWGCGMESAESGALDHASHGW